MNKLSAEDRQAVLSEVPEVLRKVARERDFYKEAYTTSAARQQVVKLAQSMLDKGIRDGSVAAIADDLEKEAAEGNLDLAITQAAVDLHGTNMGKHAHVSDEISGSSGGSDLANFILS
jgi:hypothetical protein